MRGPPRDPHILAFDRYRAAHPHLTRAHGELLAAVREHGDAVIVLLAGPSGVGKSTLLEHAIRDLRAEMAPYATPGLDPVRTFLMPPFGPQGMSLKDLYLTMLRSLDEPEVEGKIHYLPAGQDQEVLRGRRRTTEAAARDSLANALGEREVAVLVGDEAQHLCEAGGAAHIKSLLESIKWLGMASGTLIVLAGTYDLRALIGLNTQLDRRTMPVHFPRYRAEVTADRDAFINVIRKFESHLPDSSADLVHHWQLLYDASNGCIGSLKLRLRHGLAIAIAAGRPMSITDLRPSKFDQARLAAHLADIQRGEHDFSTGAPEEPSVRVGGAGPEGQPTPAVMDGSRPRKPFKRRPKRDRTGSIGSGAPESEAS